MVHTLQAECSTAGTAKRKIWRLKGRTISCVIPLLPLCYLEKCTEIKDVKVRGFKGYREQQSLCHTSVVKVKLSLYTSCRHTGERRCNSSHFDLDTKWRRVVNFSPVALPLAKALPVPTEQEAVLSRDPVWTLRWIEKFIVSTGNWIMICRVFRPYPSHRLRYPSFSHISGRDDIVFIWRHLIGCFDLKTFKIQFVDFSRSLTYVVMGRIWEKW